MSVKLRNEPAMRRGVGELLVTVAYERPILAQIRGWVSVTVFYYSLFCSKRLALWLESGLDCDDEETGNEASSVYDESQLLLLHQR